MLFPDLFEVYFVREHYFVDLLLVTTLPHPPNKELLVLLVQVHQSNRGKDLSDFVESPGVTFGGVLSLQQQKDVIERDFRLAGNEREEGGGE